MLHHCCETGADQETSPADADAQRTQWAAEWARLHSQFAASHREHMVAANDLVNKMLRHGGTLPTPRSLLSPQFQSEQSELGENQIYKRESNEDSLVPEGVSLQVPPQVMDEDEMDSAALRRGMESFIERGPLFEGLEPRRGVSKKKRRLSAREKLISGASPLMHVAREMTDPHGLGSLIGQVPCGKRCAKKFLGCVEYLEALQEPPRTGCLARFTSSTAFAITVVCVILANTAVTIYEADTLIRNQSTETFTWLSITELAFSVFYVLEFLLKLSVHRLFFFWCNEWRWNVFDALLASLSALSAVNSLMESVNGTNMSFLRSFRFIKVSRILRGLRVISFVRQLRIMVSSIVGSAMALVWSLLVLLIVEVVFSILFVQLVTSYVAENPDSLNTQRLLEWFPSVAGTMITLFGATTGGLDWIEVHAILEPLGAFAQSAFLFYIAFFTIAVFNILTGIFVEKALHMSDQADRAVEYMKQEREDAQDLRQICNRIDFDGNGRIAWPEFEAYMQNNNDGFARLKACGLDVHDVHEFFVSLTSGQQTETVEIEDFINHAMRLRGTATSIQVKSVASQMMRVQAEAHAAMMWKVETMAFQLRKAVAALNADVKASRFLSSKIEKQISDASHVF